ncbi:MAG: hypothetical protein B6242_10320 [Anaerolineaceae bacterium 4572_78]|nr:MAG: hypothetical protein B6242_10320 [Anaerolineaceae bacterium 4572_78]
MTNQLPSNKEIEVKLNPLENNSSEQLSQNLGKLLRVDYYDEAEQLLTEKPHLIEQARTVFGAIVPTSVQNDVMDLAIKASADDDMMTLREALSLKRQHHIELTPPEIEQLLEFAAEQRPASAVLALNIALLMTDDLTRWESVSLWQRQECIIMDAEEMLGIDAVMLWESLNPAKKEMISEPEPKPEIKTEPEPTVIFDIEDEAESLPEEKPKMIDLNSIPPPLPIVIQKNKPSIPSRLETTGFVLMSSVIGCGIVVIGMLFVG